MECVFTQMFRQPLVNSVRISPWQHSGLHQNPPPRTIRGISRDFSKLRWSHFLGFPVPYKQIQVSVFAESKMNQTSDAH
jgi:hypothetical protein